ncbi:HD domain-containing protein [Falsiroseomonas oryziterrae]|uniref:HD domain-containing protein n=1 Tax=Falsiroseomonas oryziterrae TaxID=2911368 RepID=UPI001F26AF99|nr:HD domain-containing protein [Roseomonas sp. NPKOSM-4]
MTPDRTAALIDFLALADRLKHVERRGRTVGHDGAARQENSAEHCWNVALLAVLLHGEVQDPPELGHVLAMIAAHDLVEVEAGDTFAYDEAHILSQAERERAAADVVFGKLPPDLGARLRALWEEFEEGVTPAARFAMACDRAQGFLQGVIGTGHWKDEGVREAQTAKRMDPARKVAPVFEALIATLYERARAGRMFAE